MNRPLLFLDVETTGVDPVFDRIVQVGLATADLCLSWNAINPKRPIPPEATAVHGITDDMVQGMPTFENVAEEILACFHGHDLVGYNLRRLDLPILDEEFRRAGIPGLPLKGAQIIDCYGIFAKKHPRTLADAFRLYCGHEMTGAHNALADAVATRNVYQGQFFAHPELREMTREDLARYSNVGDKDYADLAGKLYRDTDGDLRYAFGKVRDVKVRDDTGFASWMIHRASFPGNTIDVLEAELDRLDEEARARGPMTDNPDELF